MAHFAELDINNMVLRVVVVGDEFDQDEPAGIAYLRSLYGGGNWLRTSYSGSIRKNYAGIGFYYDRIRDAFIAPKPYPSWQFVEDTCRWAPPVPYPESGDLYLWDEITQTWRLPE